MATWPRATSRKKVSTKRSSSFEAILKLQPDDSYSALWLARLYRFENQHDASEKVLRGILQHEPDNGQALEQLSQLLIDEGRSQEAVNLLSQAAGDSSSPDLYDLLGDAYSQQKDYAKAEDSYRKAVEEEPEEASHRHGLGQALIAQDKYAEALEQFKKLSELEPGTADNYLRMAELYRRLGQFDQAETSLCARNNSLRAASRFCSTRRSSMRIRADTTMPSKCLSDAIAGMKAQAGSGNSSARLAFCTSNSAGRIAQAQNYPAAIDTFREMAKLGGADSQKRAQMLLIDTYRESRDIDRAIVGDEEGAGRFAKGSEA